MKKRIPYGIGNYAELVEKIYITGVLPILIDDLTSGYNIAKFLTLN